MEQPEAEAPAKEKPLPVREWYPRQKYAAPQQQFTYRGSQPQMNQPQVSSNSQTAQPQTWHGGYQVFQAPPVVIMQPQSQWYGAGTAGQVPEQQRATQQQYAIPYYYQAPQRPWGEIQQGAQSKQQTYTAPSGGYQQIYPWSGWQAPGGTVYPSWGAPYGGYPGTVQPGYTW